LIFGEGVLMVFFEGHFPPDGVFQRNQNQELTPCVFSGNMSIPLTDTF